MNQLVRIAVLAGLLGATLPAGAETASSLEQDGDRSMDARQHELAKIKYKLALQREPKNEFLWLKYDLAHERYLRGIGQGGRGPASRDVPPRPSTTGPASPGPSASPRVSDPGGEPESDPAAEPGESASPEPVESSPPPEPEPTPSAPPPSDTTYRSPAELIYLDRPVRAGDTTPVQGAESGGQPITVKTPIYEILNIQFQVDPAGALHVTGRVKNLSSSRDLRNPSVYVALYDKNGVQIAMKPVRLANFGAVLFRGDSGDFDAAFPRFNTTVGAYRVSLDP